MKRVQGQPPQNVPTLLLTERLVTIKARNLEQLHEEIENAKLRFGIVTMFGS